MVLIMLYFIDFTLDFHDFTLAYHCLLELIIIYTQVFGEVYVLNFRSLRGCH
jgi:hypothetical protein